MTALICNKCAGCMECFSIGEEVTCKKYDEKMVYHSCSSLLAFFLLISCRHEQEYRLFTRLHATESGISFNNAIHDNDSSYSFINEFGYMGGGVGVGDFNNDGLKDIFFTGNQVSSRLYINKGNNQFEDITEKAGVGTNVWCTGVSIVDINHDGYDDIYVCVFGKDLLTNGRKIFYLSTSVIFHLKKKRRHMDLADTGYSTQAAFFDYDRDGDLDMYLTNYLLSAYKYQHHFSARQDRSFPANDRLYRNDDDSSGDWPSSFYRCYRCRPVLKKMAMDSVW